MPLPVLPALVTAAICSISSYGARCDNATDDSVAIQRALDDYSCATVFLPAGASCVSRALNLTRMSNRALQIAGDLIIWRDPSTYKAPGDAHVHMFLSATSGDGSWTGSLLSNFTLSGGGRILGGGRAWWPTGGDERPRTLWIPNASDVTVSNLTFIDSPAWNVGIRGERVLIDSMRIESGIDSCGGFGHAPNTDGFNVGGRDITVSRSWVHNGDDCVPITTGNDGHTSDVSVSFLHCECGTNGVVVYNQGGTIERVTAHTVNVSNTNQGAGVKLARPGNDATNGLVQDITWGPAYHISNPRYAALYVNVFQEDAQPPCVLPKNPKLPNWLVVRNASFVGVSATVTKGQAAGCFRCTPGAPCDALFDGVAIQEADGEPAQPFVCLNMRGTSGGSGSSPPACA
jgi:hypothetical protein